MRTRLFRKERFVLLVASVIDCQFAQQLRPAINHQFTDNSLTWLKASTSGLSSYCYFTHLAQSVNQWIVVWTTETQVQMTPPSLGKLEST